MSNFETSTGREKISLLISQITGIGLAGKFFT
ncbi:MAG: hypothetical protein BWX95_02681 [Bacteroidetes bacterium ADurb.Bin141]|nr:MAG: hypothetical protein BWX95_02681 [Bacteroidetes bacterium ADurb.Bin141]